MQSSDTDYTSSEIEMYYDVRVPGLNRRGGQLRGPCPIHKGARDSFTVDPLTGRWYCHSACGRGGDILELEMALTGADFKTAMPKVLLIVGRGETQNRRNAPSASERPSDPRVTKPTVQQGGKWREIDRYRYTDESGHLLYEVVRYLKPDGTKTFRQVRPSGVEAAGTTDPTRKDGVPTGGTVLGLDSGKYLPDPKAEQRTGKPAWRRAQEEKKDYCGMEYTFRQCPRVPYRLPKLLGADTVYLTEGEKDVHTLESWGLVASCNAGGAGGSRQYRLWLEHFRGRRVVILPDNDLAGSKHALAVAGALLDVVASIQVVELPGLAAGGDVTDWRDAGGTSKEFGELVEAAQVLDAGGIAELRKRWSLDKEGDLHPVRQPLESPHTTHLPTICVTDRPLQKITDEVIEAMQKKNEPPEVFVRSGQLCRQITDEDGRPKIETLDEHQVRFEIARSAYFQRLRKDEPILVSPPRDVVRDVMASRNWPFPALHCLVATPVLRPDGTVLATPGYDPVTRLLYRPFGPTIMRAVPETPSVGQIRFARALIEEVIVDFPFADDASRANALALLFTPILRPAIAGPVPLALVNSPKQGTGKSLLARATAMIATGAEATLLPAGHDEEEWRKKITATLRSGSTIIPIDNVEGVLDSASLAMALTSEVWKDRVLGRSEMIDIPQRATWIATGNNLTVGKDMGRRCYSIRLDAGTEQPWMGRTFRHPGLIEWVKKRRLDILWAILTLARAWYSANCPDHKAPTLGTFEDWSRIAGGILAHAGVGDFLGNLEDLYGNVDEDGPQWEHFFHAWYQANGTNEVTTAEVVHQINMQKGLRDALPDELALHQNDTGKLRVRLGQALSRRRDALYGAYRLERTGHDGHSKAKRWRVINRRQDDRDSRACVITVMRPPDQLQIATSAA